MYKVLRALRTAIPAECFTDAIKKMVLADAKAARGPDMILNDAIGKCVNVIVPHHDIKLCRHPGGEIIIRAGTVLGLFGVYDTFDNGSYTMMVTPYWLGDQEFKTLRREQLGRKYRLYNVSLIKPPN